MKVRKYDALNRTKTVVTVEKAIDAIEPVFATDEETQRRANLSREEAAKTLHETGGACFGWVDYTIVG